MLLWQAVNGDLSTVHGCRASATRDNQTVSRRVEDEGDSFLTITLADFGKEFERALDQGFVAPKSFPGFRRRRGLPAFLQGYLARIFNSSNGFLVDSPDIDAIFAVRQLTLMYGKVNLPCSDARVRRAMKGYIDCEKDLAGRPHDSLVWAYRDLRRLALLVFGDVLDELERKLIRGSHLVPRHGPGATAERRLGNTKYTSRVWTERLERVFPSLDYLYPSYRYWEEAQSVQILEPGAEPPVRVITVPKTLKTPRIIAIEPTWMQYMQQALARPLVSKLESGVLPAPLVGFTDQVPNQDLAREGSYTGDLATLDLSEASDRVDNRLVQEVFAYWPGVLEAMQAVRSTTADVPGYGVIPLSKYASMGSALTFPVEAMIFTVIVLYGIELGRGKSFSDQSSVRRIGGRVRIYGDDIIVPTEYAQRVAEALELYGFKVNQNKSFWTGRFRESCGKEFYAGQDVSIVRVRTEFPTQLADVTELVSTVSSRNQFYQLGLWGAAKWLDELVEPLLKGHYPIVETTSSVLGRNSVAFSYQAERECRVLHRPLVRGYVPRAKIPINEISDLPALMKFFLERPLDNDSEMEYFLERVGGPLEKEAFRRSGRPQTVDIKLRWATPF